MTTTTSGSTTEGTVTTELVSAVIMRELADIPEETAHEAKRLLLDFLGVGLAGSREDSGRIAADFAASIGGVAQATLLGRGQRVPALHAAFANAIASHSVELDDVDEVALFHHGPPIVAAALATAELAGASGSELIAAIVAGSETMTRLSQATNNDLRNRGFHTTPTCGVFGAAMAAGLLLDLDAEQQVSALGLAGAQAGGLMEMYGTSMQKRFNPGPAARNGVTAALMAQLGFTGADSIIDGTRGFGAAFAGRFDRDRFLEGIGSRIPMTVEYKPYSCARPIHNAIDAAIELRERGLKLEDVDTIVVRRHPDWANYHVISRPRSFHEAQMSLPYSVAIALAEGRALPEQYAKVGRGDEAVMSVSERVVIEPDDSLLRGVSCHMIVRTRAGETLEATVDYPLGSIQRPLSDDQLAAKFTSLATSTLGSERTAQVVATVAAIDTAADVSGLTGLLTGDGDAQ